MVHRYLVLPINEVQVDAVEASKVVVFPSNKPLQEHIDRVCNISFPLIGREAQIPRHIWLIGWAEPHDLSMVHHNGLVPYTVAHAFDPSHRIDWKETMSWYLVGGTISSIRIILQQGHIDMRSNTYSNWKWVACQQLSIPSSLHLHSGTDLSLCQGLDQREVMSWYTVNGATTIVGAIVQ